MNDNNVYYRYEQKIVMNMYCYACGMERDAATCIEVITTTIPLPFYAHVLSHDHALKSMSRMRLTYSLVTSTPSNVYHLDLCPTCAVMFFPDVEVF